MKKFAIIAVLLVIAMTFAACGSEKEAASHRSHSQRVTRPVTETPTTTPTEPPLEFPNEELALQCMTAVVCADTEEQLLAVLTEDCADQAEGLLNIYKDQQLELSVRLIRDYNGYDIYRCQMRNKDTGEVTSDIYCLLQPQKDGYRLCCNDDQISGMVSHFTCGHCGGSGSVVTGTPTACGQCGGTGMWYNPSVYYDPTMNMWMGQYQGCPGCGGSGSIGGSITSICPGCGGSGNTLE